MLFNCFLDQPTVTTFTTGNPGNTAVQGTTVTLTCSANGYPAPTYTIRRGSSTLTGTAGGRYTIPNIQLSEEDNTYSCEPRNDVGTGPTEQLKITVEGKNQYNLQGSFVIVHSKVEPQYALYGCKQVLGDWENREPKHRRF